MGENDLVITGGGGQCVSHDVHVLVDTIQAYSVSVWQSVGGYYY